MKSGLGKETFTSIQEMTLFSLGKGLFVDDIVAMD
jgi:hypothetical protein